MAIKQGAKQTKVQPYQLEMRLQTSYSYANYYNLDSVFKLFQINYKGKESLENITVQVKSDSNFLLPYTQTFEEIPAESIVQLKTDGLVSPVFLAELLEVKIVKITAILLKDAKVMQTVEGEVQVYPYAYWQGKNSKLEYLANYIRPNMPDCNKILALAKEQLKKWEITCIWSGYTEGSKNKIRNLLAAIYTVMHREQIVNISEQFSFETPSPFTHLTAILKEKKANPLELALFLASCLESAGLHPVLAIGRNGIACGAWLYENCFINTLSEDIEELQKHMADGIYDISMVDMTELFQGSIINYQTAEKYFLQKVQEKYYTYILDVKRCRLAHIQALPIKAKGVKGVELLSEKQTNLDALPDTIQERGKLSLEGKATKNTQWERRLLDLSMKNPLLNFAVEKKSVHLVATDIQEVYQSFAEGAALDLLEILPDLKGKVYPHFGCKLESQILRELTKIELKNKHLHSFLPAEEMTERVRTLLKKGKLAEEEIGTNIVFVAFGFLKWYSKNDLDKEAKYAPLVLCPAKIERARGGKSYSIRLEEDVRINQTLLEFLLREFHIDIRGIESVIAKGTSITEILQIIRRELLQMSGWEVVEDIYLSTFLFARFAMWNDIHQNIEKYQKNKIVHALLENKASIEGNAALKNIPMDNFAATDILMPLPADSYQFSAIAEAISGKSFVLHGPPGTGKSQTITNLIANCLNQGQRVLFVAEKQAALDVVKKRLDQIGIGDFCLELHSNKCGKNDVLRRLENTLNLQSTEVNVDLTAIAAQVDELKKTLNLPIEALHKKRKLGVSVYDGILLYQKNKEAPDVLDIESTFYDNLTEEKLFRYENMLVELSAVAKECGGIYRSPFENVNLLECPTSLRNKIFHAAQILLIENKNFKIYLNLCLDFFHQKVSIFTEKKLLSLIQLIKILQTDRVQSYFNCNESAFYTFFNANKQFEKYSKKYLSKYRQLIDLPCTYKELALEYQSLDDRNRATKRIKVVEKQLKKVAMKELSLEECAKDIPLLISLYEQLSIMQENTNQWQSFFDKNGRINFEARLEYFETLKSLHKYAEDVFIDFNADSFNSVCIRAMQDGYAQHLLQAILNSTLSFTNNFQHFCNLLNLDVHKIRNEDIIEYTNSKAATLMDNIDMLHQWCLYKKLSKKFAQEGLGFVGESLESGAITAEDLVLSFRKNVYKNFIETNIATDPVLSNFSVPVLEKKIEQFRQAEGQFTQLSKKYIRSRLIQNLPTISTEGDLSVEVLQFQRIIKSKMRGITVKELFTSCQGLIGRLSPCMLMSPITVAQYLPATADLFDLVIFDEASQLPTSDAIGAIARAKHTIVVGDPKQLPPTTFFNSNYVDEDNMELEDLENVLDDCLALNLPEKHLLWHYRSKHESLIAFSNLMYYDAKLCTYPSPDALESKVTMHFIENGVYDRGHTKQNREEALALIEEVISRLKDREKAQSSIGIVTFSTPQRDYIERKLTEAIIKNNLEEVAYDREEPIFVKNLENVQGDERDIILFSICYGADRYGKLSLNFGPLNQTGGWRRLNVAASRAREEMILFSSMTSAMINLDRTNAKGVQGLKALLEFAEKGKVTLPMRAENVQNTKGGIGKFIAKELSQFGYACRYNVGVSNFKIDCAVMDPNNPNRFILAIICDGETAMHSSAYDRHILQPAALQTTNWNILRVFTINFVHNPLREIKNIKEILDKLVENSEKNSKLGKYRKVYERAALEQIHVTPTAILKGEWDSEIVNRIEEIVSIEQPIETSILFRRLLLSFDITKATPALEEKILNLLENCNTRYVDILERRYWYQEEKTKEFNYFRVEEDVKRKRAEEFSVYEVVALAKAILESKVSLYLDELVLEVVREFKLSKPSNELLDYFTECINYAVRINLFARSISDKLTLI